MPVSLQRGIDHVVFAVSDLSAICALFKRLGFTTTPRADRQGGTNNAAVLFQGNYIELFSPGRPENRSTGGLAKTAEPDRVGNSRFSFGRYNAGFLKRRQGMSMLVFSSDDARRDLAEFAASGLTTHGPVEFKSDPADTPGWEKETRFSLGFVTDARTPDAVYFVCQNHAPENFWKPEYQRHANSADQIAEVVMVADRPDELADHFGALQRPELVRVEGSALHVATGRGQVTVLTPGAFTERYRSIIPVASDPHFAAARITVRDFDAAQAVIKASGLPVQSAPGRLWIAPQDFGGVLLELTP